jgi:hypothetical protein
MTPALGGAEVTRCDLDVGICWILLVPRWISASGQHRTAEFHGGHQFGLMMVTTEEEGSKVLDGFELMPIQIENVGA